MGESSRAGPISLSLLAQTFTLERPEWCELVSSDCFCDRGRSLDLPPDVADGCVSGGVSGVGCVLRYVFNVR